MTSAQKFTVSAIFLALFLTVGTTPCRAQDTPDSQNQYFLDQDELSLAAAPDSAAATQPAASDPAAPATTQAATAPPSDAGLHFAVSPYIWFTGVHGTIGGPNFQANLHASAADLISHLRIGLMGAVEVRYSRILWTTDILWARLGDDKAIPAAPAVTANVKATEFFITEKVGFRLINQEKLKIDALAGFRYWYFGQNLQFSPSSLGLTFTGSQNWVAPLVGGRIQMPLSRKVVVNILGDVGGWGVGSQLEYQVVGLLGYRLKPNITLQAGYRYLNFNYITGNNSRFAANLTTSGVLVGLTWALK